MSTIPIAHYPEDKMPELDASLNLVILTGAGISAESGLKTFRDAGGLWEGHRVEDVATPQAFHRNPARVHDFYNQRRQQLTEVNPNPAHCSLSVLERLWQGDFLLVTQNVDNLHERAGSTNLLHMHGELTKARCQRTGEVFDWLEDMTTESTCPCCNRKGNLRPHIVWFGEIPLEMERIGEAIAKADYFIAIGTSGIVYPAAGFSYDAKMAGAETIEMNLEPSGGEFFDLGFYGPATATINTLLKNVKSTSL